MNEVELPFYRELHINRAILGNTQPRKLAEDYSEFLKASYRECLEDSLDRKKQAAADSAEVSTRKSDANWTEPVIRMDEEVK